MKPFKAVFFEWIQQRLHKNPKTLLIYADLGYPYVNAIQKKFPNQAFNFGVRENLAILAGIILSDVFEIYVYGASRFLLERSLESLRLYGPQSSNWVLVGHGAGLSYGRLGPTHWSLADETVWSLGLNLPVFSPRCQDDLIWALEHHPRPLYLRLIFSESQHPSWPQWTQTAWKPGQPLWVQTKGQGILHIVVGSLIHELPFLGTQEDLVVLASSQWNLDWNPRLMPYEKLHLWVEHLSLHPILVPLSQTGKPLSWGLKVADWPYQVGSRQRMLSRWLQKES